MRTPEFNLAVDDIVKECQHRNRRFAQINHISARQPFEDMSPEEVLDEALEEVYDLINYGVMTALNIKTLQRMILGTHSSYPSSKPAAGKGADS